MTLPIPMTPDRWMRQIFGARAAVDGRIVRRKVADVDRIIGRERFAAELQRRGFQAVENSGQYIIFCNSAPIRLVR